MNQQQGVLTTEFWLTVLFCVLFSLMLMTKKWTGLTGDEVINAGVILGGVTGVYTGGRTLVKTRAIAAFASVLPSNLATVSSAAPTTYINKPTA